jgi:hypothetical protein
MKKTVFKAFLINASPFAFAEIEKAGVIEDRRMTFSGCSHQSKRAKIWAFKKIA